MSKRVSLKRIAPKGASEAFLRAHIDYSGDDCVLWPFRLNSNGYGLAVVGGKQRAASNWMCRLTHGAPPADRPHSAHSCGNRACVNPRHLRWATPRENALDRNVHGTDNIGERNGLTHLTAEDVEYIRSAPPNLQALAEKFGMTRHSISKVRSGRNWKYVEAQVERPEGKGNNILCRNGHLYDEANTYVTAAGYRQCRACGAENARRHRARHNVAWSEPQEKAA